MSVWRWAWIENGEPRSGYQWWNPELQRWEDVNAPSIPIGFERPMLQYTFRGRWLLDMLRRHLLSRKTWRI